MIHLLFWEIWPQHALTKQQITTNQNRIVPQFNCHDNEIKYFDSFCNTHVITEFIASERDILLLSSLHALFVRYGTMILHFYWNRFRFDFRSVPLLHPLLLGYYRMTSTKMHSPQMYYRRTFERYLTFTFFITNYLSREFPNTRIYTVIHLTRLTKRIWWRRGCCLLSTDPDKKISFENKQAQNLIDLFRCRYISRRQIGAILPTQVDTCSVRVLDLLKSFWTSSLGPTKNKKKLIIINACARMY